MRPVHSIRVAVILAAGRGKRMGNIGNCYAKALLPIGNEPLIVRHIDFLQKLGVEDIYVVVGYRALDIVTALGDGTSYGVRLHYVEQQEQLGSAHAVASLRSHIREPFLLLLGDYYFSISGIDLLLEPLHMDGESIAIAAKREPDLRALSEACALSLDGGRRVIRVVEKPVVPASDLKGCGIYALRPAFFDAISKTPRTALRDEYEISVALDLYIDMGKPVYAAEIVDWDANLTRPEDLLACNLRFLEQEGQTQQVGAGAYVADGVALERAVVGEDAYITGIAGLTDVVVFPGVRLDGRGTLERGLVTTEGYIACPAVEIREGDPILFEGEKNDNSRT